MKGFQCPKCETEYETLTEATDCHNNHYIAEIRSYNLPDAGNSGTH